MQKLRMARVLVAFLPFLVCYALPSVAAEAGETDNALTDLTIGSARGASIVTLEAEQPFGENYSAYTAKSPDRIVIDLPRMDLSAVPATVDGIANDVAMVKTESFDVSLGTLGRVEILLADGAADYDLTVEGARLVVSLASTVATSSPSAPVVASTPNATGSGENLVLNFGGQVDRHTYFALENPLRLVVDVYGSGFEVPKGNQPLSGGFSKFRVGKYADKVRVVFDASGGTLPKYAVQRNENEIYVNWSMAGIAMPSANTPRPVAIGNRVTVDALDFGIQGDRSIFTVDLSRPTTATPASVKGKTIVFGVPNSYIKPSLRRYIDTGAFPSSVKRITPYIVGSETRFAVEMQEMMSYDISNQGSSILFSVPNGQWAFRQIPDAQQTVPVLTSGTVYEPMPSGQVDSVVEGTVPPAEEAKVIRIESKDDVYLGDSEQEFTGRKISLVFDDADIRNILQLIAEVSDLNIIASEDVKGKVTLRLIDVPWDQALAVIMDISELGMLRQGNVVRILPRKKIRALKEAELSSVKTQEKLEPLTTQVFKISYTDLGNIRNAVKDVISARGKITEDARNKQLIVSDVTSRLDDVEGLIEILDTPERQVMIEARIVEVNSSYSQSLGVNWGLSYDSSPGGEDNDTIQTVDIGAGGNFTIGLPARGSAASAAGLATGITFGSSTLNNLVLDLRISALETAGQGKVVSTPKVTTLNGEEAVIKQGTTIPYTSSGDDGLPKTEFVEANLELKVTPVINPDNTVILDIEASNNTPSITDGATAPSIDTKEAETKVLVQDGETTVIGGIFVEQEATNDTGIPVLMHLPWIGPLFKSTSDTAGRTELLIFITPRILQ